jgi:hypothetical protein
VADNSPVSYVLRAAVARNHAVIGLPERAPPSEDERRRACSGGDSSGRLSADGADDRQFAARGVGNSSLGVELLFIFALAYVVLNLAAARTPRQLLLRPGHRLHRDGRRLRVGAISRGAFNPAVAIGAASMGILAWRPRSVELVAGALAGLAVRALNPTDK